MLFQDHGETARYPFTVVDNEAYLIELLIVHKMLIYC
jgi:hypothetical protein